MTTSVSSFSPASVLFAPYEWTIGICKKVYDVAMKIFQSLCCCFSGSDQNTTAIATRGVSVGGPLNLIAFYRGQEANNIGVTLDQILSWNDGRLEETHDFIQWLFPLIAPSGPNPTAAVLDPPTIQAFNNDPFLKNQILRSLRRMLSFYGMQMDETTKVITRAPNFSSRAAVWLTAGNHNFLRITRIIHSLHLLGLHDYSESVLTIMQDIYHNEGRRIISASAFSFWQRACPPS